MRSRVGELCCCDDTNLQPDTKIGPEANIKIRDRTHRFSDRRLPLAWWTLKVSSREANIVSWTKWIHVPTSVAFLIARKTA